MQGYCRVDFSLWKQLRFPFSKIFFPYLSDPLGQINLSALTKASSVPGPERSLTLSHAQDVHTCTLPGSSSKASLPPVPLRANCIKQRRAVGPFKPPRRNHCHNGLQINKQPVVGPFHAFLGFLRTAILILKRHQ